MPELMNKEMFTVRQIWDEFDHKISLRQIYCLIESGALSPAYRFSGSRGTCVPCDAVREYKRRHLAEA